MSLVTFIIPSLDRPTLQRTLESLYEQDDHDWSAIVVFDPRTESDAVGLNFGRVRTLQGRFQSAGLLRNEALSLVKTKWAAFVDDDDWLGPRYVSHLRQAQYARPELDIFISTMRHPVLGDLPADRQNPIRHGNVGISYAVNMEALDEDVYFVPEDLTREGPEGNEDIELLARLAAIPGVTWMLSPYVDYFVGNTRTVRG